jgi:site-specific DNA recombinase
MGKARKLKTLLGTDLSKISSFEGYCGLVYARVSTKRQETDGSGLTSQEGRCKSELVLMKVPCERTFPDSYTGGGDFMKRPAMRELLSYIDTHPHKKFVVIFDDLKRFARDTEWHLKLRSTFKARSVVVKCLNFSFDESPEGRFAETVMAGQAELERHQNARQVVQKQKARLDAGYYAFGSKRGYTQTKFPEHGMLAVPNKEGLEILAPALEGFANGVFLHKVDVCRYLVEKGFWTKQKPEKYIDKITAILKDPFYAGFIEYLAWDVTRRIGKHQGLISADTFDLIQKRLNRIDHNKRIRLDTSPEFPLRGLIVCDDCRGHLTAAWTSGRNKRHPYYLCHTAGCKSYGKVIQRKLAESKFDALLKKNTLKKNVDKVVEKVFIKAWNAELKNFQEQEAAIDKQKRDLEQKVSDLTALMIGAKSALLKKTYEQQIENTAQELEDALPAPLSEIDLSVPYRTALAKATGLLKNPYSIWKKLDVKEKQQLYYFIFEAKLPFSKFTGYRTTEIPTAIRLFEDFAEQKPLMVEMAGVKPACKECIVPDWSQAYSALGAVRLQTEESG